MRPKPLTSKLTLGERVAKDIRRATRRHFSAEDKIRIVLGEFLTSARLGINLAVYSP